MRRLLELRVSLRLQRRLHFHDERRQRQRGAALTVSILVTPQCAGSVAQRGGGLLRLAEVQLARDLVACDRSSFHAHFPPAVTHSLLLIALTAAIA